MKKIKLLLFASVMIAGIISIQSCQSTKTTTAAKMLKFNFEKGKGYDYEMISSMDQEVMGQDIQMDMTAYYSMVVNEDNGTTKTITSTIDRFKMKMGAMGFNLDIDTDKPMPGMGLTDDGKDPVKMMNTIFSAIKGQKFVMKVDAEGKVQEVTGFEDMANTIVDSLATDEDNKAELKQKFSQQFNGEQMKSQFERAWYIFPNKEVKVGDSWDKNTEVPGEMGGSYKSTYKVTDIEGDMVTLAESTTIASQEKDMDISGTIKGTLVVDSRLGLVVTADQDMKMKMGKDGKSVEMKMKNKIKGKAR